MKAKTGPIVTILTLLICCSVPLLLDAREFFWDEFPEENGWRDSGNFRWLYPIGASGWAYHQNFGYIYSRSATPANIWFYRKDDWMWTNTAIHPYIWSSARNVWVRFMESQLPLDPEAKGVFQYAENDTRWYWERYEIIHLPYSGTSFSRSLTREERTFLPGDQPSGSVELVFDLNAIISYLEENPNPNGSPYTVLEKFGQNETESWNFDDLSREEQKEVSEAMDVLKRQYRFKLLLNELELTTVEVKYDEEVVGLLAGSGIMLVFLPDGTYFYFRTLWVS